MMTTLTTTIIKLMTRQTTPDNSIRDVKLITNATSFVSEISKKRTSLNCVIKSAANLTEIKKM